MFTTVAVSNNRVVNNNVEPLLPASIKAIWVADLTMVALQDISAGRFGAQRHVFPSYSLVYRLDILSTIFRGVARDQKFKGTYVTTTPDISEIIGSAKVWLSFEANIEIVEVGFIHFPSLTSTSVVY